MLDKFLLYLEETFALEFSFVELLPQEDKQLSISVLVGYYQSKGFADDHATLSKHHLTLSLRVCFISSTSSTTYSEWIFQYFEFSSHWALTNC